MRSADLWQLHELAIEFAKTAFVSDHDHKNATSDQPELREHLATVAMMAAQAMEAQSCHGEVGAVCRHEEAAEAASQLAVPAPQPWVPMCTLCLTEAKEAQLRGITPPEVNGVAVFANGVGICEIRHGIQVGPPKLLVAQPGQVSSNGFGG